MSRGITIDLHILPLVCILVNRLSLVSSQIPNVKIGKIDRLGRIEGLGRLGRVGKLSSLGTLGNLEKIET